MTEYKSAQGDTHRTVVVTRCLRLETKGGDGCGLGERRVKASDAGTRLNEM